MKLSVRNLPTRFVTGTYIFHAGIEKWSGSKEQAEAIHGMAKGTYPAIESIPPERFLKLLATGEILTGGLLLSPWVSNFFAGLALSGFSGALLGIYAKTPGLRHPGSPWPQPPGIALSKDVWMLGIGLGLLADYRGNCRGRER